MMTNVDYFLEYDRFVSKSIEAYSQKMDGMALRESKEETKYLVQERLEKVYQSLRMLIF